MMRPVISYDAQEGRSFQSVATPSGNAAYVGCATGRVMKNTPLGRAPQIKREYAGDEDDLGVTIDDDDDDMEPTHKRSSCLSSPATTSPRAAYACAIGTIEYVGTESSGRAAYAVAFERETSSLSLRPDSSCEYSHEFGNSVDIKYRPPRKAPASRPAYVFVKK